jgi:hypothetical protein
MISCGPISSANTERLFSTGTNEIQQLHRRTGSDFTAPPSDRVIGEMIQQ